jgi:hypothetical protein
MGQNRPARPDSYKSPRLILLLLLGNLAAAVLFPLPLSLSLSLSVSLSPGSSQTLLGFVPPRPSSHGARASESLRRGEALAGSHGKMETSARSFRSIRVL